MMQPVGVPRVAAALAGLAMCFVLVACGNAPTQQVEPIVAQATPTPTPATVAQATPTPTPESLVELYKLMVELINEVRESEGLSPVVLGDNPAAQIHAENSLEGCISSHWGLDGLTPDMRYSLAGGYQVASENVAGSDYCRGQGYSPIGSPTDEVRKAMNWWMGSPAHRANILHPYRRKVNIGLAWDRFNFKAVQQFEGDYVEYNVLPVIVDGTLQMEGRTKNGADLHRGDHLRVVVAYMAPPQALTQGQVARTYGICLGRKVAHLSYRTSGWFDTFWEQCLHPSHIPAHAPGPSSAHEAYELWADAKARYDSLGEETGISRKVKMSEYRLDGDEFSIRADLSEVLGEHGPGVYLVTLFGVLPFGEVKAVSDYAIFYGIPRPTGY